MAPRWSHLAHPNHPHGAKYWPNQDLQSHKVERKILEIPEHDELKFVYVLYTVLSVLYMYGYSIHCLLFMTYIHSESKHLPHTSDLAIGSFTLTRTWNQFINISLSAANGCSKNVCCNRNSIFCCPVRLFNPRKKVNKVYKLPQTHMTTIAIGITDFLIWPSFKDRTIPKPKVDLPPWCFHFYSLAVSRCSPAKNAAM